MEDKEYCLNFILSKLKKSLDMKKDILEELNNNKKAKYTVKIENLTGKIIIEEEK